MSTFGNYLQRLTGDHLDKPCQLCGRSMVRIYVVLHRGSVRT